MSEPRFRFRIGALVTVRDDKRVRRRIQSRYWTAYGHDAYVLNRPALGLSYWSGDDLRRVKDTIR